MSDWWWKINILQSEVIDAMSYLSTYIEMKRDNFSTDEEGSEKDIVLQMGAENTPDKTHCNKEEV